MLFYIPEDSEKELQILKSYIKKFGALSEEYQKLLQEPDTDENKKKRIKNRTKYQAVYDECIAKIDAFHDETDRRHFKPIQEAGADAIIDFVIKQIPSIILYHHSKIIIFNKADASFMKDNSIAIKKGNKVLLNANYEISQLRKDLKLPIEALKDDPEYSQKLLEVIVEAVENSELTDNSEIDLTKDSQAALNITRYRRNPLSDILNFGLMNDKINAHLLQDGELFKQEANGQLLLRWAINEAPKEKEVIPTYIALTSLDDTDIKTTKKLTAYDKQVYEAVGTRFWNWQQSHPQNPLYITPQEIWRTMNGKSTRDGKTNPSKATIERINKSLSKMRAIDCYMDISAELNANYITLNDDRLTKGILRDYLLNASVAEFYTEKGNKISGYRINCEPVLYTYNRAKNHLLYIPYEMLDTSGFISDSENVAEFKGYLLQQIQLMKNAAGEGKQSSRFKRNNIILLDTLYDSTGIQPPEKRIDGEYANEATRQQIIRRNRKADRQKIEGILDAWTAKDWIKGYVVLNQNNEPLRERQQAKGYRIKL